MKQNVVYFPKNGLIFSRDKDYLVGITNHKETKDDEFPVDGIPVYYDLDDMNPLPFRLYKDELGYYVANPSG